MSNKEETRDSQVAWETVEPSTNIEPATNRESEENSEEPEEESAEPVENQTVQETPIINVEQVEEDDSELNVFEDMQILMNYIVDSNRALRGRNQHLEEVNQGLHTRNQMLETRIQTLEEKVQEVEDRNRELEALWSAEINTRIRVEVILDGMEGALRSKKRKIDQIKYNFGASYGRIINRVETHPEELGQIIYTMSRDLVRYIVYDEYRDTTAGGLFH